MPTSNFQPIRLLNPDCCYKFTYLMTKSADPHQLASANWSESALLQRQGISGFSRTRVKEMDTIFPREPPFVDSALVLEPFQIWGLILKDGHQRQLIFLLVLVAQVRCMFDWWSGGWGLVVGGTTFFHRVWSRNIFYSHSLSSADSRRAFFSFQGKYVHKYWLTA